MTNPPVLLLPDIPAEVFEKLGISPKGVTYRGALLAPWRGGEVIEKLAVQAALVYAAEHPELVAEHHKSRIT